jgi:nuclear transcription Y subunit beta
MSNRNNNTNEYDRFLPVANIGRIIKNNLPKEVKLSKEAKETFQECVSEFISFITSEASDKCNLEKRKTINGDDILHALTSLGFEHYTSTLKVYLDKYRESQKLVTEKNVGEESEEREEDANANN